MSTNGPYAGIKVLDFGQVMAAPYAGMLLAAKFRRQAISKTR